MLENNRVAAKSGLFYLPSEASKHYRANDYLQDD